jgi:hypothetical protein
MSLSLSLVVYNVSLSFDYTSRECVSVCVSLSSGVCGSATWPVCMCVVTCCSQYSVVGGVFMSVRPALELVVCV